MFSSISCFGLTNISWKVFISLSILFIAFFLKTTHFSTLSLIGLICCSFLLLLSNSDDNDDDIDDNDDDDNDNDDSDIVWITLSKWLFFPF